jgi:hypothetical protein
MSMRPGLRLFYVGAFTFVLLTAPAMPATVSLRERLEALVAAYPEASITRSSDSLTIAGITRTIDDGKSKRH